MFPSPMTAAFSISLPFQVRLSSYILIDGKQFRLFAVEGKDESDIRNMVQRYSAIAKSPANDPGKTGSMTLNDPLNGEVLLQWSGRRLWGAVDQPSQRRQALVQELGRNLQSSLR